MLKDAAGKERVLHERPDLQIVDLEQKIISAYDIVGDDLKRCDSIKTAFKV